MWVLLMLLVPGLALGAASVCTVDAPQSNGDGMFSQLIQWTGSTVNGSFTQCDLTYPVNGVLYYVETDPGTPAPTDNYDITFTDDMGLLITVPNCDNATTEVVKPTATGTAQTVPVWGRLLLDIANNSVASAKGKIRLFWSKTF
jgi:hypothetical protein